MKNRWCLLVVFFAVAMFPGVLAGAEAIDWMSDYQTGLERARVERKPVMIDFYTSWCYYCKVLDAKTYTDPGIIAVSEGFVCLKINAEKERQLARDFRIGAYPIIVFLGRDGVEIRRLYGYQTATALKAELNMILYNGEPLGSLAEKYKKNPGDGETGYLYADELMAKGRFKDAEKILVKTLRNANEKRKTDTALDLAICRLKNGSFKQAASELARYAGRFKNSKRLDEAELYYGLSLLASGQKQKGVETLDRLQERTPATWVGQEALRQLTLTRQGKG